MCLRSARQNHQMNPAKRVLAAGTTGSVAIGSQARSRTWASAAVFTAFVAAATSLFAVNLPLGYFNIGEIMVYTSALLMGPYVGAFAGGVGSMLSDLSLGYPQYAPGTLVIKGIEGFVVGYLSTRAFPKMTRIGWRFVSVVAGLAFATILGYTGVTYLSGAFPIELGGAWYLPPLNFTLTVPAYFWIGLATAALLGTVAASVLVEDRVGWLVLSVLIGGFEMVSGYFLYETFVLRLGSYPPTEVPFNVAQALIGLTVAVPLVRSARKLAGNRQEGMVHVPGTGTGQS
jgi:uncharacterized membrane protein